MLCALLLLSLSSASQYPRDVLTPYVRNHGPEHDQEHVWSLQDPNWGSLTYESFAASDVEKEPVALRRQFVDYNTRHQAVPGHIVYAELPRRTFSVVEPGGPGGCGINPIGESGDYARYPWPIQATVKDTAENSECLVAMNAGYFGVHTGQCFGSLVVDGHIIQVSNNTPNAAFGIRQDGTLLTGYIPDEEISNQSNPLVHLVSGVIWLVRNSVNYVQESAKAEASENEGTGTMKQFIDVISARTAIGHDKEGRVILVHVEGQTDQRGMDLNDFANLLVRHDLVNAINLDGGGSATMVVNGTLISYPTDHCKGAFRCMREVSTVVCVRRPVCRYPSCSGHGHCWLGVCHCYEPWTGDACERLNCTAVSCNNRGNCSEGLKECDCIAPGYTGTFCSHVCLQGFYGRGCKLKCPCYHASTCSPFTGHCTQCEPGWMGKYCNETCMVGYFGQDCLHKCDCSQHCSCSHFTGECMCDEGSEGPTCINAMRMTNGSDASPTNISSDSSGISLILVVLLGASVLLNALLTCALSYSSQRTKSRYDIKL